MEKFKLEKHIQPYIKVEGKKTKLMIAENPDTIMDVLQEYCNT
jgi:hypothetical protein